MLCIEQKFLRSMPLLPLNHGIVMTDHVTAGLKSHSSTGTEESKRNPGED